MIEELIQKNRSYRRFYQDIPVTEDTLRELVNLGRMSPSAANLQPLKYILSSDKDMNQKIFETLKWAAYLKDWGGPVEGERPAAYIVILGDTNITKNFNWGDQGIASQSILLGAVEKGLGGCILGAINKDKLRIALNIPQHCEILLVIALGKPKEKVVLESIDVNGDIRYYRTPDGVHHVPKRSLDEVIFVPDKA